MNAPVVAFTLTAPPPADVTGALYDNVRPAGSVNDTDPDTAPSALAGLPEVAAPATGMPASTYTDTVTIVPIIRPPPDSVPVV